jgi:hypothetical protein
LARSAYKLPAKLRPLVPSSRYEICGEVSEGHIHARTYVEEVRSWKQATSYVERYVAKPETFPEGVETGRYLTCLHLPVRSEISDTTKPVTSRVDFV